MFTIRRFRCATGSATYVPVLFGPWLCRKTVKICSYFSLDSRLADFSTLFHLCIPDSSRSAFQTREGPNNLRSVIFRCSHAQLVTPVYSTGAQD